MSYENKSRNFSHNNSWNNSSIPPNHFYDSNFTSKNWSRDQNFTSKRGYSNNLWQTPNTVKGTLIVLIFIYLKFKIDHNVVSRLVEQIVVCEVHRKINK